MTGSSPTARRPSSPTTPWIGLALIAWIGVGLSACYVQIHEDDEVDRFELKGAHNELSCSDCHGDDLALANPSRFCVDCHDGDAPDGHLDGGCGECHAEETWDEPSFEHDDFPLKGGHGGVPCIDCHVDGDEDADDDCEDCHADDIPPGHWSSDCDHCHSIWSW